MNTIWNRIVSKFLHPINLGYEDYETYELDGWIIIARSFPGFDPLLQRCSLGVKREFRDENDEPIWRGSWVEIDADLWLKLTELDKRIIARLLMEKAANSTHLLVGISPESTTVLCSTEYKSGKLIGYTWSLDE